MKKQIIIALFGILVLLLSACRAVETVSTPEPMITESPVETTIGPANDAIPGTFSKYIGLKYPPLPEGLTQDMGMLIQDAEDHSLSLLSDGESKMLWLSKMTHRDAAGTAYWEVRDILDLSHVDAGMQLFPDGCSRNGVADHEILVLGKDGNISMAWRANTTLSLFEVIPTTGIECHTDKVMSF